MVPLSLPLEDRRVILRSFWAVISVAAGCGVWSLAILLGLPFPWFFGLIIAVLVAPLVAVNERFVRRLYHAWNKRIARRVGDYASSIVLRICLLIVFLAVGRAGSRFSFGAPREISAWLKAGPASRKFSDRIALRGRPRWIRSYLAWAMRSKNAWAIVLIPFFCFLRMVSLEQQDQTTQTTIYTLF